MGINPRYIPNGYKLTREIQEMGIAIYQHEVNSAFYGIAFQGKAGKPSYNYRFRNAEQRTRHEDEFIAGQEATRKIKAEWKAKRLAPHTLKVGDILRASWGYEQTNVDFYEVVDVRGTIVDLRTIGSDPVGACSGMSDRVVPVPGVYYGEVIRKRANGYNAVVFSSYKTATKWGGTPEYRSWYA